MQTLKDNLKKPWNIYLIINTLFILPVFIEFEMQTDFHLKVYFSLAFLYYIYGLIYIDLILVVIFIVYCTYLIMKKKCQISLLVVTVLLAAANASLNIYWILKGYELCRQ